LEPLATELILLLPITPVGVLVLVPSLRSSPHSNCFVNALYINLSPTALHEVGPSPAPCIVPTKFVLPFKVVDAKLAEFVAVKLPKVDVAAGKLMVVVADTPSTVEVRVLPTKDSPFVVFEASKFAADTFLTSPVTGSITSIGLLFVPVFIGLKVNFAIVVEAKFALFVATKSPKVDVAVGSVTVALTPLTLDTKLLPLKDSVFVFIILDVPVDPPTFEVNTLAADKRLFGTDKFVVFKLVTTKFVPVALVNKRDCIDANTDEKKLDTRESAVVVAFKLRFVKLFIVAVAITPFTFETRAFVPDAILNEFVVVDVNPEMVVVATTPFVMVVSIPPA
jgi:hypothetical protein